MSEKILNEKEYREYEHIVITMAVAMNKGRSCFTSAQLMPYRKMVSQTKYGVDEVKLEKKEDIVEKLSDKVKELEQEIKEIKEEVPAEVVEPIVEKKRGRRKRI